MKKKTIFLLIIIALCLVGCGKKEEKKEEKKTGPLRLEKLNDYDVETTQTLFFNSEGDYMFLSSYNRFTGKNVFTVFKNGKVIKEVKGDVRILTDNRYILRDDNGSKFTLVDYDDIGIDEETAYSSLEYAGKNRVAAKKDKKAGLITTEGKTIIDFKYEEIQPSFKYDKEGPDASRVYFDYFLASKDGKVGVIDYKDNVIVPFEYDRTKYDSDDEEAGYYLGDIGEEGGKIFFFLKANNKNCVINESGKVLLESKGNIYSDEGHFYTVGKNEFDRTYYDLDGKEISNVKFNDRDMTGLDYPETIRTDMDLEIFVSKNKLVYFDDKNARHEIENVHYVDHEGYFITDDVYFVDVKKGVELHSLKNDSLIDTYDNVDFANDKYFMVCKDKKCGLVDFSGKVVLPLEYEEKIGSSFGDVYFYKGNEYVVWNNDNIYKYTCSEGNGIENDVLTPTDKYYIGYDKKENTYMYNTKCEKVDTGRLRNYFFIDDLNIIIAELWDSMKEDGRDTYDYVIFNDQGEVITFENKDDAKFTFYLGKIDGVPYFLTDKGMYYLTNE